jgi:hypothetical protein
MDWRALEDLATFARLEAASGDVEPWAAVLAGMRLDPETAAWAASLYNTTDDLTSTFTILSACPGPAEWAAAGPRVHNLAASVALSGERRNLYGGRICRRLDSYAAHLAGRTQDAWVADAVTGADPFANFAAVMPHLRQVWGVGRLAAFEWAEFLNKVSGWPIETPNGALWASSGPRESLERLWGGGAPARSLRQLDAWATETRGFLTAHGTPLTWWDFETVICDFNVMRKGRYYPGKHLAMISTEIDGLPAGWRETARAAYRGVIPDGWRDVPAGVDKALCRTYRDTGRIPTPLLEAA